MPHSRPPIIRPAVAGRRASRYLDAGLTGPLLQRREVMLAYSFSMLAAAAGILFIPNLAPAPTALLFVAIAVINPLIAKRSKAVHVVVGQHLVEVAAVALVVSAAPSFWPVACVWMGASLTWLAVAMPTRSFALCATVTVAAMTAVSFATDVSGWAVGVIAATIVAIACAEFGRSIRRDLNESSLALSESISSAGGFIVHADAELGRVVAIEGDIESVTGYTAEEWCATSPRDRVHPDDVDNFWVDLADVEPGTVIDRLGRHRHRDGHWIWLRDVTRVAIAADGHPHMHGFLTDVTELMEAQQRIAEQARRDPLTALPNRLALVERIEELLTNGTPFALVMLDLDRFKEVNDTLGHEAGDQMLTIVAERMRTAIADDHLLARLGGDEFAIVVFGAANAADVQPLLRQLSEIWSRPLTVRGVRTAIAASVGVAFGDGRRTDRATVMRHADIAMYEVKRNGGGSRIFDDSLELTSTMQLTLSASLPTAIANGDITLFFQPKFDMESGRLVGAEGLARWDHPELGVLAPNLFLDLTLMSEYAVAFALRTIDHATEAIDRLAEAGCPVPVAANVAIGALRDIDFGDEVLRRLDERGIEPSQLTVELTESDVLGHSPDLVAGFERLTAAGVTMSIDDFGTGHSSLERLRVLDVGELKIDRSFVDGMTESPLDRKIVETIVDLAHRLGCGVVAEGVESEQQVAELLELGCTTAQGYLYARPMPLDDLIVLAQQLDDGNAHATPSLR